MRILTATLIAMGFCALPCASQELPFSNSNSIEVPARDGSWTIQIVTTGGFDGRGRGSVTLNSFGKLLCSLTVRACPETLTAKVMQPLTQMFAAADASQWINPGSSAIFVSLCNDCYVTRVTFSRREANLVQVVTFTWNDVTRGSIPPEVLRMTDLAFSLAIPSN